MPVAPLNFLTDRAKCLLHLTTSDDYAFCFLYLVNEPAFKEP